MKDKLMKVFKLTTIEEMQKQVQEVKEEIEMWKQIHETRKELSELKGN